jgi:hypothetical protein
MGNAADSPPSRPPYRRMRELDERRRAMKTYAILRRAGWSDEDSLRAAAERSADIGDNEMSDDIRWIRSYVIEDAGNTLGTVCIYQASSPEAIREHAARVGMPADEIMGVADLVIVRPDPETVGA